MSANTLRVTIVTIGIALSLAWPAFGSVPSRPTALRISSADLDLSTRAGIVVLYTRIQDAALAVCGPPGVTRRDRLEGYAEQCVNYSVEAAVRTARIPHLTALHRTHTLSRSAL
jgi:UrcA family protein